MNIRRLQSPLDSLTRISIRAITAGCGHPTSDKENINCNCPQRTMVPEKPTPFPFDPMPENNEKMKKWLLDYFASSTFNTYPHRALPGMADPPKEIHIVDHAILKTVHTPAPLPLYWQRRVYDDLVSDEAFGVIERVPDGVPVAWCHRKVVTRKHNGTPQEGP